MNDKIIGADSEVTMHFSMYLEDGSVADSTKVNNLPGTVKIGDGTLSQGFESALFGLKANDQKKFTLPADDAFGEANPANIYVMPVAQFPADLALQEGLIVEFDQPNGVSLPGIVRKLDETGVTVDFNHPLAGQAVTFDVEIVEIT